MLEEFEVEVKGEENGDEKGTNTGEVTVKRKVRFKVSLRRNDDGEFKVLNTVLVMSNEGEEVYLVSGEAKEGGASAGHGSKKEIGGLVETLSTIIEMAIREPGATATAMMENMGAEGEEQDEDQTEAATIQLLEDSFSGRNVNRRVLKLKAKLTRFLLDHQVKDLVRGFEEDMRAFSDYVMRDGKLCQELREFFGNKNTTKEGWGEVMRGVLNATDECGFVITKIYLKIHMEESPTTEESTVNLDARRSTRGDTSQGGKLSVMEEGAGMKNIEKNVTDEGRQRNNDVQFIFFELAGVLGERKEGEVLSINEEKRAFNILVGMITRTFGSMGPRVLQLFWKTGAEQEVTSIEEGTQILHEKSNNCLHVPKEGEVSISALETRTVAIEKTRRALMCKMSSEQGAALSQCVRWFARSHAIATHLGMTLTIEDLIAFIDLNLFPDNAGQDGGNLRNYRARYVEEAMKEGMIESENGVIIVTWPDQEGVENEKDGRKNLKDLVEDLSMKWEAIIVKTSEVWFRKRSTGERTWSEVNRPVDGGACRKSFKIQDLLELVGKPGVEPIGEPSGNERKGGNKKNGNGRNNNNDKDNIEKREMCSCGLKHTFLGPCELVKNVVEKFREGCPDAVLSQMNRRGSPFISPPAGAKNAESQEQKIRRKKILLSNYSQGTRATQRNVNGRIVNKLFLRSTEYVAQDMVDDFTKMSYCSYCGYHLWKNGEGSETGHTDACCPMMTTGAEKAGFNPQYQITLN